MTRTSGREGTVWWVTGLSGSGKSTVGHLLRDALLGRGMPALVIDGDVMRAVLDRNEGHGADQRRYLAMTYARLAREVAKQGIDAVCATISMFHDVRAWNRANIHHYREIYLRVPLDELVRRDPRGLYARAAAGLVNNVVGIDLPMEEPVSPDLVVDNFGVVDAAAAVSRIMELARS